MPGLVCTDSSDPDNVKTAVEFVTGDFGQSVSEAIPPSTVRISGDEILQYAAALPRGARFGATHSRWLSPDGRLHRSFLQVFTERQLAREARAAGLRFGTWEGGHAILRPR